MKRGLIHLLRVGTHTDGNLHTVTFTKKDLKEISSTYDESIFAAPIVLGHEMDSVLGETDATPSFGWVKKPILSKDGKDLYCEVDFTDDAAKLLDEGHYKHVSVMLYNGNSVHSPVKGKMYIKHIALLGAHPPAIKGLERIKFSESSYRNNKETTLVFTEFSMKKDYKFSGTENPEEFLNENAADYLKYILADGENGFKGEIFYFQPEPAMENNWLYDEDEESFKGIFNDGTEDYGFEIVKSGDGWTQEYGPVDTTEDGEIDTETEGEVEDTLTDENESLEMTEEIPAENEEVMALKEEITALKEKMAYMESQKDDEFIETMYSEGRLVEGSIPKADLKIWLSSLNINKETLGFSEGVNKTPKDFAKDLLSKIPPVVAFGETAMETIPETVKYKAAPNTVPDQKQLEDHDKTLAYMEEHGMDKADTKAYMEAYKMACVKN